MDLKSFVGKAKDAAAAAAAAVAEQAKGAGMTASVDASPPVEGAASTELAPLAGEAALPAPAGAAPPGFASQKLAELAAVGAEKTQQLMLSFQQALPAIALAGYELTEFEVELGVTPKLIPHFRHAPRNDEDVGQARESLRDNKLGGIILGALLKAGEVHKQIKVAGFCFAHIEIELGLIPSVKLQYKNEALALV